MYHDLQECQLIELTQEISRSGAVSFDPEEARLEGSYGDELSAHRAKKIWAAVLERNFLLELGHDFNLKVKPEQNGENDQIQYSLGCLFLTACGRYAFWRLTNNQAAEAQYLIETAHVPGGSGNFEGCLLSPDLREKREVNEPSVLSPLADFIADRVQIKNWFSKILQHFGSSR